MRKIASIAALGFMLIAVAACKQETTNPAPEATATEVVAVPVPGPTSTSVVGVPVPGPTSTEVVIVPGPTVTETVAAKPTPTP